MILLYFLHYDGLVMVEEVNIHHLFHVLYWELFSDLFDRDEHHTKILS